MSDTKFTVTINAASVATQEFASSIVQLKLPRNKFGKFAYCEFIESNDESFTVAFSSKFNSNKLRHSGLQTHARISSNKLFARTITETSSFILKASIKSYRTEKYGKVTFVTCYLSSELTKLLAEGRTMNKNGPVVPSKANPIYDNVESKSTAIAVIPANNDDDAFYVSERGFFNMLERQRNRIVSAEFKTIDGDIFKLKT